MNGGFTLNREEKPKEKLTIFITIDTEDAYFEVPRLITGEGLQDRPGIGKIMDIMEKYGYKGNFFLDVYGFKYNPDFLREISLDIHGRGHAVELHTHSSSNLSFYNKPLYRYSLPEQIEILEYGKNLIAEYTGEPPVAHRGGSYAFNESTMYALSELGIPIDSSLFHNHVNNHINECFTINRMASYFNTLEIPVTYVKVIDKTAKYVDSKFDLDWLSYDELVKVITLAKTHRLKTLTLFLHSFSFIQKKTKPISEEENPAALFRGSSPGRTVYCEIYGTDQKDIEKFDKLLHYISNDPEIEVMTFKDWHEKQKVKPADYGNEFIPVIDRIHR